MNMKPVVSWRPVARDGEARRGVLCTPHGEVETPTFMPVGTAGSVKYSPRMKYGRRVLGSFSGTPIIFGCALGPRSSPASVACTDFRDGVGLCLPIRAVTRRSVLAARS